MAIVHEQQQDSGGGVNPAYDRDATIAALADYFELIQKIALPADSVVYPPAGGWSWPADTSFSPPKSEEVIDLMRHLPYFRKPDEWDSVCMYEQCGVQGYSNFYGEGPHDIDPWVEYTTLPPHVLMIGKPEGRDGHHVFFDTERGTWTICDFTVGSAITTSLAVDLDDIENPVTRMLDISDDEEEWGAIEDGETGEAEEADKMGETDEDQENEDDEDNADDDDEDDSDEEVDPRLCQEHWKGYATYTTQDFFARLKGELLSYVIVPIPRGQMDFTRERRGEFRDIFRKHGWPGTDYRKEECIKEVGKFRNCEI